MLGYLHDYFEKPVQIRFRMRGVMGLIRLHGTLFTRHSFFDYTLGCLAMLLQPHAFKNLFISFIPRCLYLSFKLLNPLLYLILISHAELEHGSKVSSNMLSSMYNPPKNPCTCFFLFFFFKLS